MSIFFSKTVKSTEKGLQDDFFGVITFLSDAFYTQRCGNSEFIIAEKINKCTSRRIDSIQTNTYLSEKISNRLFNNIAKEPTTAISKKTAHITIDGIEYPLQDIRASLYAVSNDMRQAPLRGEKLYLHPVAYIHFFNTCSPTAIDAIRSGEFAQQNKYIVKREAVQFLSTTKNATNHVSKDLLLQLTFVYKVNGQNASITKIINKYDLKSVITNFDIESLSDVQPAKRNDNLHMDEECIIHALYMEFFNIKVTIESLIMFEYKDKEYSNINGYSIEDVFMLQMDAMLTSDTMVVKHIKNVINKTMLGNGKLHKEVLSDFVDECRIEFLSRSSFDPTTLYTTRRDDIVPSYIFLNPFTDAVKEIYKKWFKRA